jgi:hypothetical protein
VWVDVAPAAEENAIAVVQGIVEVAIHPWKPEADAADESERPLKPNARVVAEVVQAQREADYRLS